jgi:hypothetical protein
MKLLIECANARKYFGSVEKYLKTLDEASKALLDQRFNDCSKALAKLPTADQLIDRLLEKINKHGKGIYRTLKGIEESEGRDNLKVLKATSSLITHALIEAERGNREFLMIVPTLIEKCSEITYKVMIEK